MPVFELAQLMTVCPQQVNFPKQPELDFLGKHLEQCVCVFASGDLKSALFLFIFYV